VRPLPKSTQVSIDKFFVMQKQVWKFCACFFMRKIGLSSASGIGVITGKVGV
jgi:hypothetical protein